MWKINFCVNIKIDSGRLITTMKDCLNGFCIKSVLSKKKELTNIYMKQTLIYISGFLNIKKMP